MSFPAPRVIYSVIFFVLSMILIIVSKPSALFDPETGAPRPFGFAPKDSTLFSLGVVMVSAAITSLYLFAFIDLIWGSSTVMGPSNQQYEPVFLSNTDYVHAHQSHPMHPAHQTHQIHQTHQFVGPGPYPEYNYVPAWVR